MIKMKIDPESRAVRYANVIINGSRRVASGYTSPEKTSARSTGIEGFVEKPFELAKLTGTVRDVLDGVAV